jgi:predicted transcriptional regulator
MQLKKMIEIIKAEVICGEENLDMEVKMACGCDLMSHVLAFIKHEKTLLLTGLTTPQAIYIADAVNVKAICFVRGKRPMDETVQLARERDIVLLLVSIPLYEACGKLYKEGLIGCSEYESEFKG